MRKILTLAIATMMLLVSMSIVSTETMSQDITGPFMPGNEGLPITLKEDQVQDTDTGNSIQITDVYRVAQSFTVGASGSLEEIEFYYQPGTGSGVMVVQIYTLSSGFPDIPLMNPAYVSTVGLPTGMVTVFLNGAIDVQQGETYALVIYANTAGWDFYTKYNNVNPYKGGNLVGSLTSGSTWYLQNGGASDMRFKTHVRSPTGFSKVAWHDSGDYALAVTGSSEDVFRYDRRDNSWSLEFNTGSALDQFRDIIFDSDTGMFYLVGESNGWPFAYTWDSTNGFLDRASPPSMGGFYSVAPAGNYFDGSYNWAFLAVGENSGGAGYAAWWSPNYPSNGGWREAITGLDNEECLLDVAWDGRFDDKSYYAVGYDTLNSYGVIYYWGLPGTTMGTVYAQDNPSIGKLNTIKWCPDYASNDYCLMGGDNQPTAATNLFKWQGYGSTLTPMEEVLGDFQDIDWFPDGSQAILVGGNNGESKIYNHIAGDAGINDISGQMALGIGTVMGVACKAPSSPSSAILTGAVGAVGFFPSALNQDTKITANAAYPHLYWIGFNDTTHASRVDQQVMPDDWYEFSLAANYSQGWTNCEVVVEAWYDNGAVGALSAYPAETPENRCLAFRLLYDAGTGGYTMSYPGPSEYAIGVASETNLGGLAGEEIYELRMEVELGPQTRAANGDGFVTPDPDYDPLKNVALQDINSWDFSISVRDASFTTASQTMFSEFGINKMVSISAAGNPSGNAPPGSYTNPLGTTSQITYSSNSDYWVNVSIPNLYLDGDTGSTEWIDASNVNVSNSNFLVDDTYSDINGLTWPSGRPMQGPDIEWSVWGNSSTTTWAPAPGNGTVAFGPWGSDFNNGITTTDLNWWVTVPAATQEGVYWATIMITIDN